MSFTVNNAVENGFGVLVTSYTVSISVSAGHTVAVAGFFNDFNNTGATLSGFSDSSGGGNTYVTPVGGQSSFAGHYIMMGYSLAIANAITSVTVSITGGGGGALELIIWDITATGTIAFADSEATFNSSMTTAPDALATSSLSITGTDAIILSAGRDYNSNALSAGTGFSLDVGSPTTAFYPEHRAVTASAIASFTDSTAGGAASIGALAFQVSGGGGSTFPPVPGSPNVMPGFQQHNALMVS